MNTPIYDYVKEYSEGDTVRLHMPGHKGKSILGFESMDITEIAGADALYHADGIIAESEENATCIFNTGATLYSTEGSSQCIKAMLYLALLNFQQNHGKYRPTVVAARNVHASFLHGISLLDMDVIWTGQMHDSICQSIVTPEEIEEVLKNKDSNVAAVYVTSPDYLGDEIDIAGIASICKKYEILLLVDNAHGAYLPFLDSPIKEKHIHPIEAGADMCSDSAHKTLPVLTGGAYLHINKNLDSIISDGKKALALFGSTSPSYLTLASLDKCNDYLENEFRQILSECIENINRTKNTLIDNGWNVIDSDPLKLTIKVPENMKGQDIASQLRNSNIECEFSDLNYVVLMFTPFNDYENHERLINALGVAKNEAGDAELEKEYTYTIPLKATSIREAVLGVSERVSVELSKGRICSSYNLSCPPAIPIIMPGEVINDSVIDLLKEYNILSIEVLK